MNAVKHIDKHDRVFGLDMLRSSLYIKGRPSLQLFSYAQALRGADLNFSFTEHCSRIVQYRTEHAANPGRKLIWEPETTRREDMVNFNKVLLNADQSLHEPKNGDYPVAQCIN